MNRVTFLLALPADLNSACHKGQYLCALEHREPPILACFLMRRPVPNAHACALHHRCQGARHRHCMVGKWLRFTKEEIEAPDSKFFCSPCTAERARECTPPPMRSTVCQPAPSMHTTPVV